MVRVLILLSAVMIAAAAPIPPGVWPPGLRAVDGQGRAVELPALFDTLAASDVVVVGEEHNDPAAHRFELAVLQQLASRGRKVALAMEMFERDQQPALADYVAGRIGETEMLARIKPWSNYAADYRPLVEFARAQGWTVVGSNVPRTLAAQVSRQGPAALDALPPQQRAWAAADLQCLDDAYYAKFAAAMGGEGGGGDHGGSTGIANLFRAQCLKDETMAESVAALVAPGVTVVHVNGSFHSEGRLGLVSRVQRRAPGAKVAVVTVVPKGGPTADHAGDDFVILPES